LKGKYLGRRHGYVSEHWGQICAEHEEEFPQVRSCHPGTFNVVLDAAYAPPSEAEYRSRARDSGGTTGRYRDGNYLSPRAKVTAINGKQVEAWLYRGGHASEWLELLSADPLAQRLSLRNGDAVTIEITEFTEEGGPSMPGPPAARRSTRRMDG
jgi:hypothetical protein